MFKNIFKHRLTKDKSIFSRNSDHPNHPNSPSSAEDHNDKPFEIDIDNLSSYDQKELHAFIKKYEQYTHSLRGQFNDVLNECLLAREKLTLLEEERKRLMHENDQYKGQIEIFKKIVDEKAFQAGAGVALDKEAMKQLENSGLEFEKEELNISKQLKENAEKLIEELKKILMNGEAVSMKKEEELHVNKDMEVDRQGQDGQEESPREEEARTTSESDSESKPEAETDVEQKLQENEVKEGENPEEMKNNEIPQTQSLTVGEDMMSVVLGKVETELRKVFEEHWNAIDMMLKKEKEMAMMLNMEILKSGKMEEYEKEINALKVTAKDAEKLLQDTIVELENRVKEVEKNEKMIQEGEVKLEQEKTHHGEEMMLQKKIAEDLQIALNKMKEEDEANKNIIQEIKKENGILQQQLKEVKERLEEYSEKVKQIENIQQEYYRIQQRNKELETEKEEFDEKLNKLETKRNDTENSLIQEKLKHHQTSGDLVRANEKLEEMEKNLNEEIEARKADVWKNEDLKKHIVELERKLKEYIKMIKKLSHQVAELENKEKNERMETNSSHRTNSDPDIHEIGGGSNTDTPNKQEYGNKGYYETRLEDAMSQINELKEANQKLLEEKDVLKGQAKILQEKRETGLQEIKRLSGLLEQARSPKAQNPMVISTKVEEISKPIRIGSMNTIKVSKKSKAQEDLSNLRRIKKGLDEVYKSIIMTITTENLRENSNDERKAVGKLGELVKGPLPSEGFMTIEKKMNDTIVLFQEYMENFE